jgi:methionyl-tRNA formyltransferase
MIGVTLHLIDAGVDTGGIIAHARPDIEPGDDQHTIGCRTIIKSADLLVEALRCVEQGRELEAVPQWKKGKLYKRKDLTGEAVRKVREREASGYVAEFVERRRRGEVPPVQLIRLDP